MILNAASQSAVIVIGATPSVRHGVFPLLTASAQRGTIKATCPKMARVKLLVLSYVHIQVPKNPIIQMCALCVYCSDHLSQKYT